MMKAQVISTLDKSDMYKERAYTWGKAFQIDSNQGKRGSLTPGKIL